MYDADQVLQRIDDHTVIVLALGGLALVCNYVFFGEAARLARRDRCVPFLLLCCAFWFPHDGNYLLDAQLWFDDYDHWFPKLFWVALVFTFTFECVYLSQTLRYGRREWAPALTQAQFRLWVVATVALGVVLWKVAKDALEDDLYLAAFMVTAVWALLSGYRLALRRGSRRGQSPLQWGAYTGMVSSYGALSIFVFGGSFARWPWVAMCVMAVVGGAGLTWWLARAPAWEPAPAADQAFTSSTGSSYTPREYASRT
ncbi:hypothetical protein [Conexibacter sp. SYSU D00693]|uniref:hypothetical protein n=1 Tax=Conexibacter sp. SYSU D00693 TaxID=2812560 RepID=UPI00196AA0FC|nr:hypothetical protein [Conexibacter sp. SYSU D00693]